MAKVKNVLIGPDDLDEMPDALKELLVKAMLGGPPQTKYGPKKPLRSDAAQALQAYISERDALQAEGLSLMKRVKRIKDLLEAKHTLLWAKINDAHPDTVEVDARFNSDDFTYQVETTGDDAITSGFVMAGAVDDAGKPVLN